MNINPFFAPTVLLGVALYGITVRSFTRPSSTPMRIAVAVLAVVCALPGALFAAYYSHAFDRWGAFYAYRAIPGTELTAIGLGFTAGVVAAMFPTRTTRLAGGVGAFLLLVLCLVVPYVKTICWPLDLGSLRDKHEGQVTLQTSSSTCGAACASTLLTLAGVPATEARMARECYTTRSGTENWYIARALRRHGLRVRFVVGPKNPVTLPYPSMAGTEGHFVTVLGKTAKGYIIGDPLTGTSILANGASHSGFAGFFLVATR